MNKTLLLILIFKISPFNSILSQDYTLPEFTDRIEHFYWVDTIDSNQIKYFDNGNIKVKYTRDENNNKVRNQYYENGNLKYVVKVKQVYRRDTTMMFDYDTYDETLEFHTGYGDMAYGTYEEYYYYHNSNHPIIKTQGQYENGYKTGKWTYHNHSGHIQTTIYTFIDGDLSGPFISYYPSYKFSEAKIKIKGNYKKVNMNSLFYYDIDNPEIIKEDIIRRVGDWELYDNLGNLIEVVNYSQK